MQSSLFKLWCQEEPNDSLRRSFVTNVFIVCVLELYTTQVIHFYHNYGTYSQHLLLRYNKTILTLRSDQTE